MLPSRGIYSTRPVTALRNRISGPRQITLQHSSISNRQFSQIQRPSRFTQQLNSRTSALRGTATSLPRVSLVARSLTALGVFSQTGASRSWSIWTFGGSKQQAPTAETKPVEPATSATNTASNTPTELPASDNVSPPDVSALNSLDSLSPFSSESFTDLDAASVLDIPEQIGYLKALGLDFGWGPTSMLEWMLEHIHIWSGLPWWGSIAVLAVGIRLMLIVPYMRAAKHQAIMAKLRDEPRFKELHEQSLMATTMVEQMQLRAEMKGIYQKSGYSFREMVLPHAIAIPLGFCMFRLLRNMTSLPVPGLETGGFGWITDLTAPDPLYILPMFAASIGFATFKMFQKTAVAPPPEEGLASMAGLLPKIIIPATFIFTLFLPTGINIYFIIFQAAAVGQQALLLHPAVRRYFDLPPLPPKPMPSSMTGVASNWQAPTPRRSIRDMIRNAAKGFDNTKNSLDKMTGASKKAAKEKVRGYEEKRAAEEKNKQMQRRWEQLNRKGRK